MLIKTNSNCKIEDFYSTQKEVTIITNIKPNYDLLNNCETLKIIPMVKTAKVIRIAPREEDFIYIRNRAISAGNVIENSNGTTTYIPIDEMYENFDHYANMVRGANDNGDFFSKEELEKSYKSFIGKAVFVDHDNENIEKARGIILDAVYNPKGNFVELLKAIDKKAYPELAQGILKGYVTDTSMGCRCAYSVCSYCLNQAAVEEDFCEHIKRYKGSTFNGFPIWEDNRDCTFFEDSMVVQGADPKAKILEKVASLRYNHNIVVPKNVANNEFLNAIKIEKNQRYTENKLQSLGDNLKNLPWS